MYNLEKAMIKTLRTDFEDTKKEINEVGIDNLLKDGLLDDIPIINALASVYNSVMGVRESFFIKKILEFLNTLSDTSLDDRVKFLDKHHHNGSGLGEKLIILIDRLDDIYKAPLIANLFKSYLYEKIDSISFHRLSQIVERCFSEDLKYLKANESKEIIKGFEALGLANCGLADRASFDGGDFNNSDYNLNNNYKINELGKMLIECAFNEVV